MRGEGSSLDANEKFLRDYVLNAMWKPVAKEGEGEEEEGEEGGAGGGGAGASDDDDEAGESARPDLPLLPSPPLPYPLSLPSLALPIPTVTYRHVPFPSPSRPFPSSSLRSSRPFPLASRARLGHPPHATCGPWSERIAAPRAHPRFMCLPAAPTIGRGGYATEAHPHPTPPHPTPIQSNPNRPRPIQCHPIQSTPPHALTSPPRASARRRLLGQRGGLRAPVQLPLRGAGSERRIRAREADQGVASPTDGVGEEKGGGGGAEGEEGGGCARA